MKRISITAANRWLLLSMSLGMLLGGSAQATANLITNGSFESPVLTPGTTLDVAGGNSTTIPGWTVVGSDVLLVQTTYSEPANGMTAFNAEDGLNSLDVTGTGNSGFSDGVQQTVATTPGQTYILSFDVGGAHSDNANPNYVGNVAVDLAINGVGPGFGSGNPTPNGLVNWYEWDFRFTASTSSTTIKFTNGTSSPTNFAGLDNIILVASPEPSSVVLLGLGALAIAAVARRKKRVAGV